MTSSYHGQHPNKVTFGGSGVGTPTQGRGSRFIPPAQVWLYFPDEELRFRVCVTEQAPDSADGDGGIPVATGPARFLAPQAAPATCARNQAPGPEPGLRACVPRLGLVLGARGGLGWKVSISSLTKPLSDVRVSAVSGVSVQATRIPCRGGRWGDMACRAARAGRGLGCDRSAGPSEGTREVYQRRTPVPGV